jgi:hypothetical protein
MTNYLLSARKGQPAPEVGMGVTILRWTDRDPGTITRVSPSGKSFWFREDLAERTDGGSMSEYQEWAFTADAKAPEQMARLTKAGWRVRGTAVRVGSREKYYDFSF